MWLFGLCFNPIVLLTLIYLFLQVFRVVMQYERAVCFRLGKFAGIRGPGLIIVIPIIEKISLIDTRIQYIDIPKQETLTKDNISTFLNAVVYYRVKDPSAAVLNVQNYKLAIFQHGQAAMRDIAGSYELDNLLFDREKVATDIYNIVSKETQSWGIEIISINIQDIELPVDMKKAMARQAQAERDKRATLLVSLGEVEAANTMAEAARIIAESPGALHLRTLQALSNLSADKTNNITYLLPFEGQNILNFDSTGKIGEEKPSNDDISSPKFFVEKKSRF